MKNLYISILFSFITLILFKEIIDQQNEIFKIIIGGELMIIYFMFFKYGEKVLIPKNKNFF